MQVLIQHVWVIKNDLNQQIVIHVELVKAMDIISEKSGL